YICFFFSSRRRHTRSKRDWSSDVCSSDLTRTWYGARISLFIGLAAAFIDLVVGVIWGSISGYIGGKVDEYMMRIADILTGLPYLLVVVLLTVIMPRGL